MKQFITHIMMLFLSMTYAQNTTLFLIDNSEEIKDEKLLQKRKTRFQEDVWRSLKKDGDKVAISYLYEMTSSISNRKVYTLKLKPLRTEKLTNQQAKIAKIRYQKYVKHKRRELVIDITNEVLQFNETRKASHILSALSHIAFFKKKYNVDRIYFHSDMVENSPIRSHYKTRINSPYKAKELGKKDALIIQKKYLLDDNFLKDVQITIYMPLKAMETRKMFEWIPLYWGGVFDFFGNQNQFQFKKL